MNTDPLVGKLTSVVGRPHVLTDLRLTASYSSDFTHRLTATGVARPSGGCGSHHSRYGPAMPRSADAVPPPSPVTADDLDQAVQLAVAALREAPSAAWDGKAGSLEWDCW